MTVMDSLNAAYGKQKVKIAAQGFDRKWKQKTKDYRLLQHKAGGRVGNKSGIRINCRPIYGTFESA